MSSRTCLDHLLFPLKYFVLWLMHFRPHRFHGTRHDILLIRDFQLGDFFYSAAHYGALARMAHACGGRLCAVLPSSLKSLIDCMGCFDQVWYVDQKKLVANRSLRFRLYESIAGLPVRKVVYLVTSRHCLLDYLALASGAKDVYAFDILGVFQPNERNMISYGWTTKMFSHVIAYDEGCSIMDNESKLISMAMDTPLKATLFDLSGILETQFQQAEILGDYYVVVPGSNVKSRCWPPQRFAQVMSRLSQAFPTLKAVLLGTAKDGCLAEKILELEHGEGEVVNLCGKTELLELFQYIKHARMVLTNDTGPLHVAAHLGVRTFCVMGHGQWGVICPQPLFKSVSFFEGWCDEEFCNWSCRKSFVGSFPCLCKIPADAVAKAMIAYVKIHEDIQSFYRFD